MAEDTMFEEAVDALRQGNKARARELLTMLLNADQGNATYWIWLSAAVDNQKERIYCLQTALKLDPENAAAKRGLILLGALPPDETVQSFPLNRPRAWEEKLLLAHEQPKPSGVKAVTSNPVARLAVIGIASLALIGLVILGFTIPRSNRANNPDTFTPGPSPTFTFTVTVIGGQAILESTPNGPPPLWTMLDATYTPTPPYVNTPRSPISVDQYRAAQAALKRGDLEEYVRAMREVIRLEPDSADLHFQIGEAYRLNGNAKEALAAYNDALKIDDQFAAAYLGLARASLLRDPGADVLGLYDLALQADPNYGEVYLDRGNYHLLHKEAEEALADFASAEKLLSDLTMVYYGYARAYLMLDDTLSALEYAEKVHEMDITILPNYLLRARLYIDLERYTDAAQALDTYVLYDPQNGEVHALLGEAAYRTGDCEKAVTLFTKSITLDPRQRQVYFFRAMCELEAEDFEEAQADFERGIPVTGETFEVKIGLTRAYYGQEKFGTAYQQAEGAMALAQTDEEKALVLYWRALAHEGRNAFKEARDDWQALLKLPKSATTEEMRAAAEEHLEKLARMTPSPTLKPTNTPTRTKTPPPPTNTKKPTPTPTRTRTPKP
ncbi:MAG: tetratricopeptide repeat protein [Chloroflexota bacterium]